MKRIILLITILASFTASGQTTTVIKKDNYKFKVNVPDAWNEFSGLKMPEDSLKIKLEWGIIPSEKQPLNTISITAYHRVSLSTIQKLVDYTFRVFDLKEFKIETNETDNSRVLTNTKRNYKGKYYFITSNGYSYVLYYRSEIAKYDTNLAIFEKFRKGFKTL